VEKGYASVLTGISRAKTSACEKGTVLNFKRKERSRKRKVSISREERECLETREGAGCGEDKKEMPVKDVECPHAGCSPGEDVHENSKRRLMQTISRAKKKKAGSDRSLPHCGNVDTNFATGGGRSNNSHK